MKKLLLSFLLVFPLCGFAQKGMHGVGGGVILGLGNLWVDGSVGEDLSKGQGVAFKYEYNIFDRIGVASNISLLDVGGPKFYQPYLQEVSGTPNVPPGVETVYELADDYIDYSFLYATAGLDLRFFVNKVRPFRTYVFCGIDLGMSFEMDDDPDFLIGLRSGLGFNWRLGYNCSLQLELPINFKWGTFYVDGWAFRLNDDEAIYRVKEFPSSVHSSEGRYYDPSEGRYVSRKNYYSDVYEYSDYYYSYYMALTPTISIVYNF